MRGSGDYTPEVSSIVKPMQRLEAKIDHIEKSLNRDAASTIGRTLGAVVGQPDLGAMAGRTLAKLFGHGDYTVKVNSLIKGSPPVTSSMSRDGKRGTRIVEREYIGDIFSGSLLSGSTQFTNDNYPILPTNPTTFPWLSTIANLYDQWEPNGIVFEFVSTSSEYNGVSQALGTVIMSTDYDVYDSPYPTKSQMENADYACSTKPSVSLMHGIECDMSERPTPILYTDQGSAIPKTSTTLGNFQLATVGCSAANVLLGELWVAYDITFYKKQLEPLPNLVYQVNVEGTAPEYSGRWSVPTNWLSNVGFDIVQPTPSTSRLLFPTHLRDGYFWFYYHSAGTAEFTISSYNLLVLDNTYVPSSSIQTFVCRVQGVDSYLQIGASGVASSPWMIACTQVPSTWALNSTL